MLPPEAPSIGRRLAALSLILAIAGAVCPVLVLTWLQRAPPAWALAVESPAALLAAGAALAMVGSLVLGVALAAGLRRWVESPLARFLEQAVDEREQARAQRVAAEAEYRAACEQLQAINEELSDAKAVAESGSVSKSQFLANMSHEIRTPMNGVLGVIDLLCKTPLNHKQREYADVIRNSGASLLAILNEILDFSKLEAGKLCLEIMEFDPRQVVGDALELFAGRAQLKGIEIACEVDPKLPLQLRGDPGRLRQVLTNLLDNGIKFTERGGVVILAELAALEDDLACIEFKVRDTGIGIAPESLPLLFDSFSQADASTTRRFGGTGLGLSITRRLVEMMQGTIQVESKPARGTTFTVRVKLPCLTPRPRWQLPAWLRENPRVLVAEAGALQRSVLCRQLKRYGLEVDSCESGAQVMERVRAQQNRRGRYRLALLDQHLPGVDGVRLAEALRDDPLLRCDRVVVLSAFGDASGELETKPDCIDVLISKPIRIVDLERALLAADTRDLQRPSQAGALLPSIAPGHALVVEDSYVNRLMTLEMLALLDWKADVAENGEEAVAAASRQRYDVILMDCQMPKMDGYQATRLLRMREAEEQADRVHIIALTANAMSGDREKCLEAGMDDYLSKPFTLKKLVGALKAAPAVASAPEDRAERGPEPERKAVPDERMEARLQATFLRTGFAELDPGPLQAIAQLERAGRSGLLQRMVDQFGRETVQLLTQLRDAARAADAETAMRAAHTLKSNSAHVGATRLAELCRAAEQSARAGSTRDVRGQLAAIDEEYRRVRAALDAVGAGEGLRA